MANPVKFEDLFLLNPDDAKNLQEFTAAVQGLGRNYRTFTKNLESDGERVKGLLAALGGQTQQLRQQVSSINLLNDQERTSLAALASEVAKLAQEQARLQKVQEAQVQAQQRVKDATTEAQSALRKMQNELREAYAAKDTERIEKAATSIRQYKTETLALSAAIRGSNSEFSAAKGSYDALDAENKKLIASLKALEGGIGSGSGEALRLQKQIAANTQTLKSFDEGILVFNRNIGNYKDGFGGLVAELAKARAAQAALTEGTAEAARQQMVVTGFQTAAQKSAAQMGLSYEQAEAKIHSATAALRPLATSLLRLEQEQRDVAKTTGEESEQYRKLGFQIQQTKKQLDDVAASTVQAETKQSGFSQQLGFTKEGLTQYAAQLAVGAVGLQALVTTVGAAFSADSEFQTALSSLSALTGATGDDLQFLADKAQALGPQVGKSASEVLTAFEQIGSAKPELLDNTKALADFTEQTLLLAAASREQLPDAAAALTGVMNQFQAPAEEATRYVNALAAGAKEGAATIPQSAEALKYFGVNAATANISVEKSVALIQTLAERSIKGEQAGTQLRAVLAKLASGARETNPEVVGLSTALDNLGKRNLSTAQYTKLFGLENANTARILVESRQKVEDLTAAVTGTNVASEQATRQLDNVSTAGSRFVSVLKNLAITALDPFSRGLGRTLNELSTLLSKLTGATKTVKENTEATAANGLANQQTATTAQALLDRYVELTAKGVKPAKDGKGELNLITLQLRDSLGESAAAIDKETGLLVLNEGATRNLIKQKLLLSNQTVSTLVLEADALKEQQRQQELSIKAQELEISGREKILGLTREQAKANIDDYINNSGFGELNEDVAKLSGATLKLDNTRTQLAQTTADYNAKLEALAKLNARAAYETGLLTSATTTGTTAQKSNAAALAATNEQLDRAAQQRAKNRVEALRDQLTDNQERLKQLRDYQAQQSKLFEDNQLTPEVFAESVRGSEDLAEQIMRDGAAIRIRIVRAEAAERLQETENDRIRQSNKKNISEAELTDIQQQYALRAVDIERKKNRDIAQVQKDLKKELATTPLEFKIIQPEVRALSKASYEKNLQLLREAETTEVTVITQARAAGLSSRAKYEKDMLDARRRANEEQLRLAREFGKDTHDLELEQARISLETAEQLSESRKRLAEQAGNILLTLDGYYTQFKQNGLDAELQNLQAAYDQQVAAAGNNAALKTQIEKKYQKEVAKLNYEKAKAEREQALYTIGVQTAVAVAKAFAESPVTFGLPFSAVALVNGLLQTAVVLSKPLPSYFKGRQSGPAEFAQLGERGPELVGQPGSLRIVEKPSVGYLASGDRVYTAPETRQILAQNELVEGRLVQRQYQRGLEQQATQLGVAAQQREQAQHRALAQGNSQLLAELREVRREIVEQGYRRWDELGRAVTEVKRGDTFQRMVNQRYKGGRG